MICSHRTNWRCMGDFVHTGALMALGQRCKTAFEDLYYPPFTTTYSKIIMS